MTERARIAIVVGTRGRGSNMRALAEACARGEVPAEVATVISPADGTQAVGTARQLGLRVDVVAPSEDYGRNLMQVLQETRTEWICLAGFMRLLPLEVLQAYPNRVLNIHPALLPKFGGKGMYGMHVHEAVIASGETESGCSVHLVSERYDEGAVLMQAKCQVLPGDSPESLAARILDLEHKTYPQALKQQILLNRS